MPGRPYVLAETTWNVVKETAYEVAILPWGATEAHNYHLPYSTDVVQSDHICAEAARLAWEQEAKVQTRLLPTYHEYKERFGREPPILQSILGEFIDFAGQG